MKTLLFFIVVISANVLLAHPAGNVIVVKDRIFWSYVYPIGDIDHHACVMVHDSADGTRPLLVSDYPASDFFLSNNGETIYIVESRYLNATDTYEVRILKHQIGGQPEVSWPWFEDRWRIGTSGFFMRSDTQIVFAKYPNILSLNKGSLPKDYLATEYPVGRIRKVAENQLLIQTEKSIHLSDLQGKSQKTWENLEDPGITDAPMNRNTIFDADYLAGQLLIAYWGKRSFELIDTDGARTVLKQHEPELVPHWVAFYQNKALLFASQLDFNKPFSSDGTRTTVTPHLLLYDAGNYSEIWNVQP